MPMITDNRGSHMDFHYLQRVKVYRLSEEGKWDDRGTGHVSVEYLEQSDVVGLVVIDEDDNETLLVHHISAADIYRRQEDTIIAWRDPEIATELALSFQETMGCSFIWDQICSVQRSIHFPSVGAIDAGSRPVNDEMERSGTSQGNDDTFHEGSSSEVRELPQAELSTLPLILKTVTEGYIANHIRVAELIVQDQAFFPKLLDLFKICEDVKNTEGLHLIFKIMKGIIALNSLQIFEMIFSDKYIMDVVGALEYDPELPCRREHRAFLREQVMFKEAMTIRDPSILSKIHQTYRVGYIKDVVLPRVLDEVTFATMNSIIHSNNAVVMSALKDDSAFMHEMFTRLKSSNTPDQAKKDLILFLQEFCSLSKNLQLVHQMRLFRTLVNEGLFEVVTDTLQSHDKALRLSGTDILIVVLSQDPSLLRTFVVQQEGYTLLGLLVKGISTEFGGELYSQFLEIIRMLLDPYTMAGTQRDTVIGIFYDKYMDQLIDVITSACPAKGSRDLGTNSACFDGASARPCCIMPEILSNICDLLCFCVLHHSYRIRDYFVNNNVIEKVLRLTRRKEKYLVVAAVRFLRTIISRNDDFLHQDIMKKDLFDPVILAFMANGNRYNLLNSAVLELLEFIRKENYKSLIAYLVKKYSRKLEKIDYVDTFQALRLKYEQSLEGYPSRDITGGGKDHGGFPPNHISQMNAIADPRKRSDDRVLEKEEEEYFNEDSDDEEDSASVRISVASSQPTHAVVGNGSVFDSSAVRVGPIGLVDYEDEDDDSPLPVSTSPGGIECFNSGNKPSSLLADVCLGHETGDCSKAKRRLATEDSNDNELEALKKHRLHKNAKDYAASADEGDKVNQSVKKGNQDCSTCNHERIFEGLKAADGYARKESCTEGKDSLATGENSNGCESSISEAWYVCGKDTSSSTLREGSGSDRLDNGIEENSQKDKLNEDKLGNASIELVSGGLHQPQPNTVQ